MVGAIRTHYRPSWRGWYMRKDISEAVTLLQDNGVSIYIDGHEVGNVFKNQYASDCVTSELPSQNMANPEIRKRAVVNE